MTGTKNQKEIKTAPGNFQHLRPFKHWLTDLWLWIHCKHQTREASADPGPSGLAADRTQREFVTPTGHESRKWLCKSLHINNTTSTTEWLSAAIQSCDKRYREDKTSHWKAVPLSQTQREGSEQHLFTLSDLSTATSSHTHYSALLWRGGRIPLSAAKPPEQRLFNAPSASDKQTHIKASVRGQYGVMLWLKACQKCLPTIITNATENCLLINYNQLFSAVGSSEGSEDVRLKHNEQRGIHPGLPWKSGRVASQLSLKKSHVSSCFSQTISVSEWLRRADRGSFVPRPSASVFVSVTSAGETSTDKTMWTEARSNQNTAKEPRGERRRLEWRRFGRNAIYKYLKYQSGKKKEAFFPFYYSQLLMTPPRGSPLKSNSMSMYFPWGSKSSS